ncbi:PAAR domain-containing protein [Paraburkholderia bannensis]|uniref:PAAR domain-containing protein n=1 Tax=Paraburkholderia bannensis TaxID=765414 RepID=UPI002ABE4AC5|nr:PAAR domain-containing protein [Paraburkholderia bannensis]
MFDRLASDGDRTSTGGEVIGRSGMYDERGKMYARKGNKATCGTCKGAWEVYGTANDWMDEGFPMVKDGDRVLCPCGKNFVFAWGGSNALFTEGASEVRTTTAAPARRVAACDEQFALRDAKGVALTNTYYTARMASGKMVHGITDTEGRTERHVTDGEQPIKIYIGHKGDS